MEKPSKLDNPDFSRLISLCEEYIKDVSAGGYVNEDFEVYIFEQAITSVFVGKDIWKYINSNGNREDKEWF